MLSLMNLFEWDKTIMDGILLPQGIDGSILVNTIVAEFGEMDVVHHTPERFKFFSDLWFKRKYRIIEKLYESTLFEYDPIENYRRYEDGWENNDDTETRDRDKNTKDDRNTTRNMGDDYTSNVTGSMDSNSNTKSTADSVGQVSPYNSDNFLNDTKTDNTSDSTTKTGQTTTDKTVDSRTTDETTQDNLTSTESENETIDNERRKKYGNLAHGNIGVTTTQQMIQQEREVVQFDIYWWIASHWAADNIVMVWS